jgi:hypothetical protein
MRFLLLIFTILLMTNCDKTEYVTMVYNEYSCSSPWGMTTNTETDKAVLNAVESFFDEMYDLELKATTIKRDIIVPHCMDCSCLTGSRIFIEVDEAFTSTLEDENFYLE